MVEPQVTHLPPGASGDDFGIHPSRQAQRERAARAGGFAKSAQTPCPCGRPKMHKVLSGMRVWVCTGCGKRMRYCECEVEG